MVGMKCTVLIKVTEETKLQEAELKRQCFIQSQSIKGQDHEAAKKKTQVYFNELTTASQIRNQPLAHV